MIADLSSSIIILVFLITIVCVYAGWFAVRDIAAGIIFKSEKNINAGDHIRFNGFTGRIQKVGIRCLHLKKDENTRVIIPYSNITSKVVEKLSPSETTDPYIFVLNIKKTGDDPAGQMEKIRQAVLCCIWNSLERDPQVQFVKEQDNEFVFQVTVYPLIPEYGMRIETVLKNEFPADLPTAQPPLREQKGSGCRAKTNLTPPGSRGNTSRQ